MWCNKVIGFKTALQVVVDCGPFIGDYYDLVTRVVCHQLDHLNRSPIAAGALVTITCPAHHHPRTLG